MTEHLGPQSDGERLEDDEPSSYGAPRPRAPRLTREDVFEAADALLLQGQRVTIDRVRQHLGRGSPNTIQEHLEAWWAGLGGRLRDIPGREFPDLPEALARELLKLWTTALTSAHANVGERARERDQGLGMREAAITLREAELADAARLAASKLQTQEDALAMAREQLIAGNQRADRLEGSLQSREEENRRLAERVHALERDLNAAREKLDSATAAHQGQHLKLEARYEASESRWLQEVDRARQALKAAIQGHEKAAKESRAATQKAERERDRAMREWQRLKLEAKEPTKKRLQLEKQRRSLTSKKPAPRPNGARR